MHRARSQVTLETPRSETQAVEAVRISTGLADARLWMLFPVTLETTKRARDNGGRPGGASTDPLEGTWDS